MEREHFERELRELRDCVGRMGDLVCARLEACLRALPDRDQARIRFVLRHDEEINALQIEIDDRAVRLLAAGQPTAVDLRFIIAAIRANADLERIGDQAVNVAGAALQIIGRPELAHEPLVIDMGWSALAMVRDALESFLDRNAPLARSVLERDDDVDAMKRRVLRDLITLMTQDTGTIERAISLVFISRSFERVADHATNVAEGAIFLVEAKDVRHHHQ
jgi:phosphate transport system protein